MAALIKEKKGIVNTYYFARKKPLTLNTSIKPWALKATVPNKII